MIQFSVSGFVFSHSQKPNSCILYNGNTLAIRDFISVLQPGIREALPGRSVRPAMEGAPSQGSLADVQDKMLHPTAPSPRRTNTHRVIHKEL